MRCHGWASQGVEERQIEGEVGAFDHQLFHHLCALSGRQCGFVSACMISNHIAEVSICVNSRCVSCHDDLREQIRIATDISQ